MPELDYHPEPVSLHDCAVCGDRGIEIESREYCQACYRGKRRKNMDSFAEKLRGLPFTDAMWIVAHSTINTERAIAAAELALLKSKLLQAERELAEVRKDAMTALTELYHSLPDIFQGSAVERFAKTGKWMGNSPYQLRGFTGKVEYRADDMASVYAAMDQAKKVIDAASVAQANKEQSNG